MSRLDILGDRLREVRLYSSIHFRRKPSGSFLLREAYYGNSTDAGENSEKIIATFYWCKFTLMMHSDCHSKNFSITNKVFK